MNNSNDSPNNNNKNKIQKTKNYLVSLDSLKNQERRNILFSRLTPKHLNEGRYTNLMSFWYQTILEISKNYNVLIFTPKLLQELFTIDNVKPMFLPLILNEMGNLKQIQTLENFLKEIGWTRWIFDKVVIGFIKNYTGLMSTGIDSITANSKFIIEEVIKEKVEEIYNRESSRINTTTDSIISMSKFENSLSDWSLSKEEIDLLIQVLIKCKYAVLVQSADGNRKGLKFKNENDTQPLKSDESDFGILSLQITYDALQSQEKKLHIDIEAISQEIIKSLRSKKKEVALLQLKKKKQLEEMLEKRLKASNQISEILMSIESSQTNQQILDSMVSGVATLKKVNEKVSVDQVDNIMEDLEETLTNHKEIEDIMKSGFSNISASQNSFSVEEEQELEDELKALEEEVKQSQSVQNTPIKQPPITTPTKVTSPISTKTTTTTTPSKNIEFPVLENNETINDNEISPEEELELLNELKKLQLEEQKSKEKKLILESN